MPYDFVDHVERSGHFEEVFRNRDGHRVVLGEQSANFCSHSVVVGGYDMVDLTHQSCGVNVNGHDCDVVQELVDALGGVVGGLAHAYKVFNCLLPRLVLHHLELVEAPADVVESEVRLQPRLVEEGDNYETNPEKRNQRGSVEPRYLQYHA